MLVFGPEAVISATKDTEKNSSHLEKKTVLRFGYTLKGKFNFWKLHYFCNPCSIMGRFHLILLVTVWCLLSGGIIMAAAKHSNFLSRR